MKSMHRKSMHVKSMHVKSTGRTGSIASSVIAMLLALGANAQVSIPFEETFSGESTPAQLGSSYRLWTVSAHEGALVSVSGGALRIGGPTTASGISATVAVSGVPIEIEAELGGGGAGSKPCFYATILAIGDNNVVIHPGCQVDGMRGPLRVDGSGGFPNRDIGWIPAENELHRLVVRSDGKGSFNGTLTDGKDAAKTYSFSWTNAAAVGKPIGLRRYGHQPGEAMLSKFKVQPLCVH